MADPRVPSMDETFAVLNQRAKNDGDSFRLRVFRKRSQGNLPEAIMTIEEATVSHIASPEQWLPKLAGGGPFFTFAVYHASDTTTVVAQGLQYQIGGNPLPEINIDAMRAPNWQGPKKLIWPDPSERPPQTSFYSVPAQNPQPSLASLPGATAPQTSVPAGTAPTMVFQSDPAAQMRLDAERAQLSQMRRELEEQRHKMELDAIRRESDARFAALEAKLTAAAQVVAAPAQKQGGGLAEVITAIAPLIQQMITSQDAMKLAMFQAQQAQSAQQSALLTSVLERKTDDSPNTKMMATVAESMGSMMRLTTDSMKAMNEAMNGPEEPVGLRVVKEVVKGINQVAAGMQAGGKVKVPPAPPPHPQRPPQPQQRPNGQQPGQQLAKVPQAAEPPAKISIVDVIEARIRARHDPALVATQFVQSITNPDMIAALNMAGNDPIVLFQARLGSWAENDANNGAYVMALAQELNAQLHAAGALAEDPANADEEPSIAEQDEEDEESEIEDAEVVAAPAPAELHAAPAEQVTVVDPHKTVWGPSAF